jgi:hypothetical protein
MRRVKEDVVLKMLNDTPEIISFLYDVGLLPEQLEKDSNEWHRMLGVVLGYMPKESIIEVKPTLQLIPGYMDKQ